jgi:hypothetical protein
MKTDSDALKQVRAGLCDRIDRIAEALPHQSSTRLCENIDIVRRIAVDHGFSPVAQLARGLERTMAAGERGAMVLSYLDMMRDAVGCDMDDGQASEAYLAAVSVRLAG